MCLPSRSGSSCLLWLHGTVLAAHRQRRLDALRAAWRFASTADCEVRAADCHVRPRQCHVLASDSDVLVRNWRLPWFQWQVRKTEWQRRAGEKQARRSGCHVRRFECRVRQFQCRLRKRQRHVRRFRWHVRPIHGSTRGSLMPVVSMTAGFFTPSLIGYEPFFRARDALRINLRVSLEDKDDSPD